MHPISCEGTGQSEAIPMFSLTNFLLHFLVNLILLNIRLFWIQLSFIVIQGFSFFEIRDFSSHELLHAYIKKGYDPPKGWNREFPLRNITAEHFISRLTYQHLKYYIPQLHLSNLTN